MSEHLILPCPRVGRTKSIVQVLGEYAKFLDVTKQPDLMHFKVINFILLVIMVWTRAIHWVYCAVDIYITWWNDEKWSFMVIGGVIMLLFSCFNAFFCVLPTWKRFLKVRPALSLRPLC